MKKLSIITFGLIIFLNQSFASEIEDANKAIENKKLEEALREKIKDIREKKSSDNSIENKIIENPWKSYFLTAWIIAILFFAILFWVLWMETKKKVIAKRINKKDESNELIETKRLEKKVVPNPKDSEYWKKMNELIRGHIGNMTKKDLKNLTNMEIIEFFKDFFEKNIEIKEILLEINKWMYWRSRKNKEKLADKLHIIINRKID